MHIFFRTCVFIALQIVIFSQPAEARFLAAGIERVAFYKALASTDVIEVDQMLRQLNDFTQPEKTAYEGALLMKKAGLVKKVGEKLSLFKSGRAKLEEAIKNNDDNTEYHFLRLIIQENSPKIVRYRSNLNADKEILRTSFINLPAALQHIVRNYSKSSKILKPTDF